MGTIDLRGDGVNTEMETGSRSTAAPIVAHRASWSEKFRGTPLTEANQAIQAYAWTVGQLRYAQLPHSPTTQPQPDISFATESGHLHLLLTHSQRYDIKMPCTQSWTLGVQRQIGQDGLVSATYTGSNFVHVWANPSRHLLPERANGNCCPE